MSKFLSLVLRHQPEKIGITLDSSGWVSVSELLDACQNNRLPITKEELETIVSENDKRRFSFSEDRLLIRANQGHSVSVALEYQAITPPDSLYHGTIDRFLQSISELGLIKGKRHHVHLSEDIVTAEKVGARRGKPIVLKVHSGKMFQDGYLFYMAENGVWLTDSVPPSYLELLSRR